MNPIIRNLQIDLIMDNPNPIIYKFNDIWNQLSVCEINIYHYDGGEFVYYDKNNEWVFYIDNGDISNDGLYCSKTRYWDVILSGINFDYNSTFKMATKILLEYNLNTHMMSELSYAEDNSIQKLVNTFNKYIKK